MIALGPSFPGEHSRGVSWLAKTRVFDDTVHGLVAWTAIWPRPPKDYMEISPCILILGILVMNAGSERLAVNNAHETRAWEPGPITLQSEAR